MNFILKKASNKSINKTDYCKTNKIPLLRISYMEINEIPKHHNSFIEFGVQIYVPLLIYFFQMMICMII